MSDNFNHDNEIFTAHTCKLCKKVVIGNCSCLSDLTSNENKQGHKADQDKPRYDLLPPIAIDEMAKVMTFGAKKYEPDNWRLVEDANNRYLAAMLRHAFAISRGELNDPETGLPHAAHVMCCAAFLIELMEK